MIPSPHYDIKLPDAHSAQATISDDSIIELAKLTHLVNLKLASPNWVHDGSKKLDWVVVKEIVSHLPSLTQLTLESLEDTKIGVDTLSTSIKSLEICRSGITQVEGFHCYSHLEELRLDSSYLPPEATSEFGMMPRLRSLTLQSCTEYTVFEYSKLTQITKLAHRSLWIRELSPTVCSLTQLRTLDLAHGNVAILPEGLTALQNLSELSLFGCSLDQFPESVLTLTKLEFLMLSRNPIKTVPDGISRLTYLHTLGLAYIGMKVCPAAIGALTQLTWLSVADNWLTIDKANEARDGFPIEFNRLTRLTTLKLFNMDLERIPPFVFALPQKIEVDISHNQIWTKDGYFIKEARVVKLTYIQWTFQWISSFLPNWNLFRRIW